MSSVAKLAKPQLRGHFNAYLNRSFIICGVVSALSGVGYYLGVLVPHRKDRDDFYATFDREKEFERLRDLGLFWSVGPKDPSKALYNFKGEMP